MPEQHITSQPYSFHGPLCEIAKGCDEHLCGSDTLSFIAWSAIGGAALSAVLLPLFIAVGS